MTSVQTIYGQVCYTLCEDPPNGLTLGMVTLQQFLDILGVVLLDFCQRTGLVKTIFTAPIKAGVSLYQVPDDLMKPELAFVSGKIKERVTEDDLTNGHFKWRTENGWPRQWHEDNLPPKYMELYPRPSFNGVSYPGTTLPIGKYGDFFPADNNLTMIGAAAPDITAWTLVDSSGNPVYLQAISDVFTPYLVYGILEQIFSADGEMRDLQRAAYCRTRFLEAVTLAEHIAREDLLDDEDE